MTVVVRSISPALDMCWTVQKGSGYIATVSNAIAAMGPILLSMTNILKLADWAWQSMFVPSTYESEAGGLRAQG